MGPYLLRLPRRLGGKQTQTKLHGSIVIDGGNILAAVQYLNRQRLRVLYAKAPLPEIWCSDGGIILGIGLRY